VLVSQVEKLEKIEDSVYHSRPPRRHASAPRQRTPRVVAAVEDFSYAPPAPKRQPLSIDLNTADTTTLQLLHGIGPTFARRIVAYRDRLGGFVSKDQLLEVYGFTPELLHHIEPHIAVGSDSIRRLHVNSIALKQLIRHPYIEYFQARDLINLRSRGVRFESLDDLRAMPSMSDSTLDRLAPYLLFD